MASNQRGQPIGSAEPSSSSDGMLSGVTNRLSSAVSGGQGSGDNQSHLSKGIDAVQQSVYGQSKQTESATEKTSGTTGQEKQDVHAAVDQADPEKISEFLRDKYYSRTEEQEKEEGRG